MKLIYRWQSLPQLSLWFRLRMPIEAEIRADDDRGGQQRLRFFPTSGVLPPVYSPAVCPFFKKSGFRRIGPLFFFPLLLRWMWWIFFKQALDVLSFWDYVPNTQSSPFYPLCFSVLLCFIFLHHFSLERSFMSVTRQRCPNSVRPFAAEVTRSVSHIWGDNKSGASFRKITLGEGNLLRAH